MTQEFDFHASIKWLAEAEITPLASTPYPSDLVVNTATGRIAPFASLRLDKQGVWSHRDCVGMGICQNLLANGSPVYPATDCEGRGWIPEPDVEKACWRAFWLLPYKVRNAINGSGIGLGREEVVLRVAEAWLKERDA